MTRILLILSALLAPISLSAGTIPKLASIIKQIERKYGLPKGIVSAIISVESGGLVHATNPNDGTQSQKAQGRRIASVGLMQIQLAAARDVGFKGRLKELYHPMRNIEYGSRYLKKLLNTHHSMARALVCFNSGPASRACSAGITTPYVGKVLNAFVQGR